MGRHRLAWLGLTPEPERELPRVVATLRAALDGRVAIATDVDMERRQVEALVLRGTERGWLRYLGEVTQLVRATVRHPDTSVRASARHAGAIVLEHHHMLIGLPGHGYAAAADQRATLTAALTPVAGSPVRPDDE